METNTTNNSKRQLVIVDGRLGDYRQLIEWARRHAVRLTATSTGAGGLRLAPSHPDALWLVGTELPDMPGLELLEMIRSLVPGVTAYTIDNRYDPTREKRALEQRAARYLCKPVQPEWVSAWRGFTGNEAHADSGVDAVRPAGFGHLQSQSSS